LTIPCIYYFDEIARSFGPSKKVGSSFSEGVASVQIDNKWGFINKKGELVIPCIFDWPYSFSEGLAAVYNYKNGKKMGFIDKKGEFVILCIYEYANDFYEGLARVKLNNKWGFIDKKGEFVIPCIYESASDLVSDCFIDFSEGIARVKLNDKWGFIDKKGTQFWED